MASNKKRTMRSTEEMTSRAHEAADTVWERTQHLAGEAENKASEFAGQLIAGLVAGADRAAEAVSDPDNQKAAKGAVTVWIRRNRWWPVLTLLLLVGLWAGSKLRKRRNPSTADGPDSVDTNLADHDTKIGSSV